LQFFLGGSRHHVETIAQLEGRGLRYRQNFIGDIGLRQIFVQDPNAVTLELNFRDTEKPE